MFTHSRSQSFHPFGQRRGSRALAGPNLESANRGLPARLRSRRKKIKKNDQKKSAAKRATVAFAQLEFRSKSLCRRPSMQGKV